MNITQRRALLDSLKGKFVLVEWTKADGSVKVCTIKHLVHSKFAGGHASKAQANTVAGKENYYTCVNVSDDKWCNVNLETLKKVKCNGKEYQI
jgi:hypothetical protein